MGSQALVQHLIFILSAELLKAFCERELLMEIMTFQSHQVTVLGEEHGNIGMKVYLLFQYSSNTVEVEFN